MRATRPISRSKMYCWEVVDMMFLMHIRMRKRITEYFRRKQLYSFNMYGEMTEREQLSVKEKLQCWESSIDRKKVNVDSKFNCYFKEVQSFSDYV